MKKLIALGAVASALALGSVAWSQDKPGTERRGVDGDRKAAAVLADDQFVKELGHANKAEVKLGQLARRRADSEAVKDYGRHMIDDHSKAWDELAAVAKKKGLAIPDEPDAEQKQAYERLDRLAPAEFDKEFAALMVKDHEKVISIVESFAKDGRDADLKAWAQKTLPILKHHLEMAQGLQKKVSG